MKLKKKKSVASAFREFRIERKCCAELLLSLVCSHLDKLPNQGEDQKQANLGALNFPLLDSSLSYSYLALFLYLFLTI